MTSQMVKRRLYQPPRIFRRNSQLPAQLLPGHGGPAGAVGPDRAREQPQANCQFGPWQLLGDPVVIVAGQPIAGARPDRIAELGIARTYQNQRVFANLPVRENILIGAQRRLVAARPGRVLVIGAGFTGSEVASVCRELDVPVTVAESGPAPLVAALGGTIGAVAADMQREAGVDLRCGWCCNRRERPCALPGWPIYPTATGDERKAAATRESALGSPGDEVTLVSPRRSMAISASKSARESNAQ